MFSTQVEEIQKLVAVFVSLETDSRVAKGMRYVF